jgi:hypothetical protein
VNTAVIHATGREPAEFLNRPLDFILEVAAGGAGTARADPLSRALAEGHDLRDLPATLLDKHGGRHPVHCTLFPLRDGNKVVGGIVLLRLRGGPPA